MKNPPLPLLGSPAEMSKKLLPTNKDVLLHHYYIRNMSSMGNPSFNDLKMDTISCLKEIYGMVP